MNFNAQEWISTVISLLAIVLTLVLFRTRSNREELSGLREKDDDQEARLTTLEERVANLPTHEQMGQMHEKINKVGNEVKQMHGEFNAWKEGANRQLDIIQNYLTGTREQ
jgi:uncharacterized coiled-coil DUF342 family protein